MNRLRELRIENGLTQQKIADIAEVSKRTYIYWERGETQIKPEKAQILADFFEVNLGYLLGYTENKFDTNQVIKTIKEKLSNLNSDLDQDVLNQTLKIVDLSDFLNMDLETLSNIYFYNLNRQTPMRALSDLYDFFDSEAHDYMELLSIVEPYQANGILQEIDKLDNYRQELSFHLEKIKAEEEFLQTTGYPINTPYETNPVKITKRKKRLSDEEIKALPKEKREEYIKSYADEISKEISDLSESMGTLKHVFQNTSLDLTNQMSEFTSDLIKMLADIEQMKTSTNSRPTQEKDNL